MQSPAMATSAMRRSSPILLSLFTLLLLNGHCSAAARAGGGKPVVLPVRKDWATSQYVTVVKQRTPAKPTPLVVDLGLASSWVDCGRPYISSTFRPVRCGSPACKLARTGACTTQCAGPRRPGCSNNTCGAFPENPVTKLATGGDFIQDALTVATADGTGAVAKRFVLACGSGILLNGLAGGALGMLSLSRSPLALPKQLAAAFRIPRKVAICLPSSTSQSAKGVVLVGASNSSSEHYWPPMTYTRLHVNRVSTAGASTARQKSDEYFIAVKSILVSGSPVSINATLLTIDKNGVGGTKISTATPYTVLETSIYAAVTAAFRTAMRGVPLVAPVAPLELCYDASKIGATPTGPAVPEIDFVVTGGGHWRLVGANSMAVVREGALCLGVVDGGESPRTAVVIGGLQMEDNVVEIDLERSMLGFSSSLLLRGRSCSDYGFNTGR